MKYKFLLLSFLIAANVTSVFALHIVGDHGSVSGGDGGGWDSPARLFIYMDSPVEVRVFNSLNQEVARVGIDELEYSLQNLTSGEYILLHIDSKGRTINETLFFVE